MPIISPESARRALSFRTGFGGFCSLLSVLILIALLPLARGQGTINLGAEFVFSTPLNPVYRSVDGMLVDRVQHAVLKCPEGKSGSLSIPVGITGILQSAFKSCVQLADVQMANGVLHIDSEAFSDCSGLASVNFSDGLIFIGASAFTRCENLANVTLPNSVTTIEAGALSYCSRLTSVSLGNGLRRIANATFECWSLHSFTTPDSVTNIGEHAFANGGLTNFVVGRGVITIEDYAFGSCFSLMDLCFRGDAPSVGSFAFTGAFFLTNYYLPGATGWGSALGDCPTALWLPRLQTMDSGLVNLTNEFAFNISWAQGMSIAVDACTNLSSPLGTPLQSKTLTLDSYYFRDPDWTNYPSRFYRVRWP